MTSGGGEEAEAVVPESEDEVVEEEELPEEGLGERGRGAESGVGRKAVAAGRSSTLAWAAISKGVEAKPESSAEVSAEVVRAAGTGSTGDGASTK